MAGATDLERLVVQLSADVRTYQRSLDKARGQTNKAARDIESRFNRMQRNISSSLSNGFKGFATGALGALALNKIIDGVGQLITKLGDLSEQAEKVGTNAASLEALSAVAEQDGAAIEDVITALKKLNVEVGKAKATGEGKLFELFTANDKKFSDDVIENFKTLADLAKNTTDEQTKAFVASLGLGAKGFSNLLVTINRGSEDIARAMKEAVPDPAAFNEAASKADEFGDKWKKAWRDFRNEVSLATVEIVELLDALGATGALENLTTGVKNFRFGLDALQHPTLLLKTALEDLTGLNFGAAEQFQRDILKRTEAEINVVNLKTQQVNLEKQIAELRNMGGGSSPRLQQLEAELKVLQQQLAVSQQLVNNQRIMLNAPQTGPAGPAGSIPFFNPRPTTVVPGGGSGNSTESITKAIEKGILAVISKVESGSNPNAVNFKDTLGLGGNINLLTMTVREVLALQAQMRADQRRVRPGQLPSSALGEFQIVGKTLESFVNKLGISLDEKFGPELQEKIASAIVAAEVQKAQGDPAKLVAGLRGQFEGLKGLTDEQILQAVANSTNEIVKGNEALAKRANLLQQLKEDHQIQVDQYKLEQAAIGATTEEVARQRAEWELIRQAKEQGFDPAKDEELMSRIKAIAAEQGKLAQEVKNTQDAYEATQKAAEEATERQAEAAQELQDTLNQVGQAFSGALQGFIGDLINGKKLTDALRDALINLGQQLLQIGLNSLFSGLGGGLGGSGGGIGGLLSGLFHDGGVVGRSGGLRMAPAGAFIGAKRYHSGRVPGLAPNEMAGIFKKDEIIFPDAASLGRVIKRFGGRGGGGSGLTQYNTFIAPDWKASIRSQNQLARTAGAELSRVNRTL